MQKCRSGRCLGQVTYRLGTGFETAELGSVYSHGGSPTGILVGGGVVPRRRRVVTRPRPTTPLKRTGPGHEVEVYEGSFEAVSSTAGAVRLSDE
jgi:hypothetical protein